MIYPIKYKDNKYRGLREGKEGQMILLITVVGAVVIFGFGNLNKKEKNSKEKIEWLENVYSNIEYFKSE